jgi:hypothetical protein
MIFKFLTLKHLFCDKSKLNINHLRNSRAKFGI